MKKPVKSVPRTWHMRAGFVLCATKKMHLMDKIESKQTKLQNQQIKIYGPLQGRK